jgi:hypothetical protein
MAVPVVAATGALATGTGTTATTNAPSGVSAGEYLVLLVGTEIAATVTQPTGWDTVDVELETSAGVTAAMFVREATGGGDDTPSVSLGGSVNWGTRIYRITGQRDTSALDTDHDGFNDNSNDTAFDHPSITVTDADSLGILFAVASGGTASLLSYPAGWDVTDVYDDAGSFGMYAATKTLAAGATGTGTITFSGSQRKAGVIAAIRPAAAGGRTTKNTRSHPLGMRLGMNFRVAG